MFKPWRRNRHDDLRTLLSSYLDGQVTPRERARVEEHLRECPACQEDLDSLRATVGLLRRMPQVEPRRSFALSETPAPARGVPVFLGAMRYATVAAAVMLMVVFAGDFLGLFPGDPSGLGLREAVPVEREATLLAPAQDLAGAAEEAQPTLPAPPPAATAVPVPTAPEGEESIAMEAEEVATPVPTSEKALAPEDQRAALRAEPGSTSEALGPGLEPAPEALAQGATYLPLLEGSLAGLLAALAAITLALLLRRRWARR